MDLFDHSRGRSSAHKRNQGREQFNQQLDVMKSQAASQAASAEAQQEQATTLKEGEGAVVAAFGVKGGIVDMGKALKGAGKGTVEALAKDALKDVKAGKGIGTTGAKAADSLLGEGATDNLKEAGKKSGVTKKVGATFEKFKASKTGAKLGAATEEAMGHTGALVNIGLGAYDLAEDFKGGKFQLKGDNDAEKTANALQIGAGVADAIGFVFPPAFVLGAALGVASQGAEVIGAGQEGEDKEDALKKAETKTESGIEAEKVKEPDEVVETTTTLASA